MFADTTVMAPSDAKLPTASVKVMSPVPAVKRNTRGLPATPSTVLTKVIDAPALVPAPVVSNRIPSTNVVAEL